MEYTAKRSEQAIYADNMIRWVFGTPLYEPDTSEDHCAPQIGDLGYVHSGGRFIPPLNTFSGKTTAPGMKSLSTADNQPEPNAPEEIIVDVPGVPAPVEWCQHTRATPIKSRYPYESKSKIVVDFEDDDE